MFANIYGHSSFYKMWEKQQDLSWYIEKHIYIYIYIYIT